MDGGTTTFSSSIDTIDGGAGTDKLVAYGQTGTNTLSNVTNVEQLTIRTGAAAASFNMATATGFTGLSNTVLTNEGSALELDFLNIGSTATKLVVQGATQDTGFIHTAAAVAGTADSVTLEVNGYNPGGAIGVVFGSGIETLNVSAVGSTSQFDIYTDGADRDGTAAGAEGSSGADTAGNADTTTLKVSGTAKVTIDRAFTGVKTVELKSTGGSAADLTGNTNAVTVTGGDGNDKVTFTGTSISKAATTADSIDLAGGTGDVLGVAGALAAAGSVYSDFVAAVNAVVKNTEGIDFTDNKVNNPTAQIADVNLAAYTNGIVNFTFSGLSTTGAADTVNTTISGLKTANTLTFANDITGANAGNDTAGSDAVSLQGALASQTAYITLASTTGVDITGARGTDNGGSAGAYAGGDAFQAAAGGGIGKVVLTSAGTAGTANSINGGNAHDSGSGSNAAGGFAFNNVAEFELKGANDLTIIGGTGLGTGGTLYGFNQGVNFNASAFTGALTIHLSNDSTTGDQFTGGSGANTVYAYAGNDIVTGGAAVDKISGGTGDNELSGLAGNDILLSSGGADKLTGGDGTDKFFISAPTARAADKATLISTAGTTNLKTITDFNASGEKLSFVAANGAAPTVGTTFFDSGSALSDKAWNATTGVTLTTEGNVLNIGTLATVVGETTVVGDLIDLFAASATAGKIFIDYNATNLGNIVVFNSARDNATYAAVIVEGGVDGLQYGNAGTDDSVTLVKLTGVAVADLSAADFGIYNTTTALTALV